MMGIGRKIKKLNTKIFGKHLMGKFMNVVTGADLAAKTDDIIAPEPKMPDAPTPAQEAQEGELEGASITLGSKKKRMGLAKPTGGASSSSSTGQQGSVGLRI